MASSEEKDFLAEFVVPPDAVVERVVEGRRESIAVTLKHKGVWRVHKNDADNVFPSDLHADRVDDKREKLDIYTGDVYSKSTQEKLYTLPEKSMRFVYQRLSETKEESLQTKLADTDKFSYLKN